MLFRSAARQLAPATADIYGPGRVVIIYTASAIGGFALSSFAGAFLPGLFFLRGGQFTVGASAPICGLIGAILTGVFAVQAIGGEGKKGLIDGNAGQVLTQLWGCLVTIAWCAIATFIILKIVDAMIGLRVTTEEEVEGLDINLHGETVH